jgi:predicted Zn-dependent peptidase
VLDLKDTFLKQVRKLKDASLGRHHYLLPNGICLDIQPHHGKTVSIKVKFNAGYHANPDGMSVGHLLEHMVYRRFTRAQSPNAMVTRDSTSYSFGFLAQKGPAALTEFLGSIRQRLFDMTFDADDINREKRTVLISERVDRERNLSQNSCISFPATVMNNFEAFSRDTEENLERTTIEDLQDFMAKHYVGYKMNIDIKGPVNPLQIFYDIQDIFGDVPAGNFVPSPPPAVADYEPGEYTHRDPGMEQLDYTIGLVIPEDFHRQEALKALWYKYIQEASWEAFRGRGNQTLYTPETYIQTWENMQFLLLHGTVLPHHAHKVIPAYAKILSDLAQGRIDPELFETAREIGLHEKAAKARELWKCKPSDLTRITRAVVADDRISLVKRGIALDVMSLHEFKNLLKKPDAAARPLLEA